jgi:hypothetical protein
VPKWRNWQTRYVQGVVGESPWEFESPLRHHREYQGILRCAIHGTAPMSEPSQPSGLDATVLHHLRGFPEELQRFGNVLKQTHGRSAVEFFLSRPAPVDSFLAALCRAARDGEDVVTVIEAAEIIGRPPAALLTPDSEAALPPPWWGTGRHRLWRRGDILRYAGGAAADGAG